MTASDQPITYASAGVDVHAGDRAVELMKESVRRATRPEVLGGLGGFAGMFDASVLKGMQRPVLATSTDGVGTKVAIAQAMDVHDTIGQDLVGMVVDDIVVSGAEPLFMTDYIACGKVVPERIAAIVSGIARGCELAGVALVGGETAEHPGLLGPEEYDVAGAATGVVEHGEVLGPHLVEKTDVIIALPSSGLHSNGYSLVRRVFGAAGWDWDRHVDELGRTLGEECLEPTRIYTKPLLELIRAQVGLHALSHVTGGGLAANLARVLPRGLCGVVDRNWTPPAIFQLVQELGRVPQADLEQTLNMGVGFVAIVSAHNAPRAMGVLAEHGIEAWPIGEVIDAADVPEIGEPLVQGAKGVDGGSVQMTGSYLGWSI
ncbi:phosphoribosylformylglycinamidine cyclo-ligase [Ornithinimicrobium humiphilum]|uniref:Phosphoribosylformylglycinamidine cyclo-ligase n=1 Tax=Ornithinimicrobium humiphilum TaxID=125288 RepID=A0A543K7T1_9MICO|nr:phosphoribosylformylglycinamidine cyclo-ligase [Ornithinimicrobium humiphilum]TQM91148.1 phosphoribosylformylglycinamidine cyclo-ligase [Ornithinimicrobium humiphilum]